jgi:hypothetical protein
MNAAAIDLEPLLDLDRYPLDRPDSAALAALVVDCRAQLAGNGMFNLDGFLRPQGVRRAVAELQPLCASHSFTHQRRHNVYFRDEVEGLDAGHPALATVDTVNHTVCGDQLGGTVINAVYQWPPLIDFLAQVMGKAALHVMDDAIARLNVMEYRTGEALNWHFDRSHYTTTLLLQAAEAAGEFEYRSGLRTATDPNYDGVARVLQGADSGVRVNPLAAGTLNVFAGVNTLHRVTPVGGTCSRIVAVLSYYDRPGVRFSSAERLGFYGRDA